ncbi:MULTISPECIES: hypothetical protein [Lactococcus]|jgi:hypothetical protein|uniref:Uncharacterized protein n=1 Tax=Lactococcus garvieae TaxID=1363 RepID=A0AA46TWD1_9LACT|nr:MULTISPECIES: hypothetical protein [Lactococcus]MDC0826547.1 hypothetical protein [Lactococcus petauri]UYT10295.1 hypothetical protein OF801_10185 [Lactococcus garvieae]UYT12362.1 hypothetical protein OF800_10320 [Lactococcus garvieae]BDW47873.1 hypothetical protein LG21E12_14540 [Lactococcus garvieae]
MDVVVKMVGVLGGIMTVRGLFGVMTGFMDFNSGRKNDNGTKVDQGIDSMVSGGVMAAITAGVTASIIVAIQAIKF